MDTLSKEIIRSTGIIIQVRKGSTRLPEKCFRQIKALPIIEHLIIRLRKSKLKIILAVPKEEIKDFNYLKPKYKVFLFGGNEEDVLGRYYQAACFHSLQTIIRVTGDNPLTSVPHLLETLKLHINNHFDLTYPFKLPYGSGVEVLSRSTLKRAHLGAKEKFQREHITQYIYKNQHLFNIGINEIKGLFAKPNFRVTIDTLEDFENYKRWCKLYWNQREGFVNFQHLLDQETKNN